MLKYGFTIQSIPAKTAPEAVTRVLNHYIANRLNDETFREYVIRYKVETFRTMTTDLAKPMEIDPDFYMDWGDTDPFSLQLGRAECAA